MAAVAVVALTAAAAAPARSSLRLARATKVTAKARSDTSIRLRWHARARRETRWEILWASHEVRLRRGARTYLVRGLRPGKRYRFMIRACRRRACRRATRLRARTRAATPAPGADTPAPGPGPVPPPGSGSGPPSPPGGAPSTELAGCPIFPPDSPWNQDVSKLPVHRDSARFVAAIGAGGHLHPDFGSGRYGDYGIPYTVVPAGQRPVPIRFTAYGDQSDPGPYPIPPDARIEGGAASTGDRHVLVLRQGECRLYELFAARPAGDGWEAASGAVWDLRSNALRPEGWTSADAAGLPILPGLARADEASADRITHALRFTVSQTQRGYIRPATHFASGSTDPTLPPMGLRLRLRSNYDIAAYHGQARAVLEALRTYGMIVADNGSDWYISGTPDPAWDDDDLDQLKRVPGSAFEAVDTGPIRSG